MYQSRLRRLYRFVRSTPLHPQWLLDRGKSVVPVIAGLPVGRVLDIGCADRWVQRALSPESEYIGLDYPATGGVLYAARPDVFADASRLPLVDASVDAVVMLEVFEHLRDPCGALAEAARVLRPGGRLLLSMPFLYPIHDAPHDYQRLTLHGLRRDVEAAGLRLGRCEASLGAAESAGLLMGLALGGVAIEAVHRQAPSIVLVPFILLLIPLVNVGAWLVGRLLPDWPALTAGYLLEADLP